MLKEASVFDRQHRVLHHLGDFLDGEQVAALFAELAHQLAIGCEHPQRQLGAVVGQVGHIGKIGVSHRQCNTDHDQDADHTGARQSDQADRKATDPLDRRALRRYWLLGLGLRSDVVLGHAVDRKRDAGL